MFLLESVFLIFLVFCVVLWCVFTFWVPFCDVCYYFRIKTMFGSYLPPVVCRRAHVLLTMFGSCLPPVDCRRAHVLFTLFVFVYIVVSNTYCVEFLFCFASSCVPFFIASFSGLSLRYSFIDSNGVCQVFYKLIKILHFIMIRKK